MNKVSFIQEELDRLDAVNQRRSLKRLAKSGPHRIEQGGRELINFSSNDYLGLSAHPAVKKAAQLAIEKYHASTASSRLVCGNVVIHEELESELASFKGREAALVFSSGYMTNIGILSALAHKGDQVFSDELNHASIIDGCRLSRAQTFVYRHKNLEHLETMLRDSTTPGRRILVSDAVFSMDGDIADLPDLSKLAEKYDCLLIVDEAHATGVLGKTGRGIREHFKDYGFNLRDKCCEIDLEMGTLSKALGSFGGFVACDSTTRDYLMNKSRSFIFSTALPPSAAAAAIASLQIIRQMPETCERLRSNLRTLENAFKANGLGCNRIDTPIIPILFGDELNAMRVSHLLMEKGFFVPAIRPPSVPPGTSRLRVTVTAAHAEDEIVRLAESLAAVM